MGAYFCMCAYECDVVVEIKIGAYIDGVLTIPILWYVYILMWPVWMFVVGKKPALKAWLVPHVRITEYMNI